MLLTAMRRDDDRRSVLVLEPAAPPDPQDGHRPCRPRGPDGDRQAVASRPRSRSRRRSAPARGGRCRPAGPPTAEANVPALAGQFASVRGGRRSRSPRPPDSGANQGALFASQVTAGGPIVAPWNTPTAPILQQPDPRKLRKCSEFLDSGEMGDPGLEPGTSSLSGKPFVPSSRPNSHLIPANRRDGAQRKGTGEDWPLQAGGPIVAPRPQFEGRASYDPEADITPTIRSSPDAPEAGRCAPA